MLRSVTRAAAAEHTVDPPTTADAAGQLRALSAARPSGPGWTVTGADGTRFDLPAELAEVVGLAAAALAEGRPVTLSSHEPVLSTQEAADLLGVSRPTLVRLLDQGVLPYDQPGSHRRLLLRDVLAFRQERHHADRPPGRS